jgi:para-aminobenzoate synthetase component 1
MSVLELDISTSPEALCRGVCGESGAFWLDGQTLGAATFTSFAPVAQLVLTSDGTVECEERGVRRRLDAAPLDAIERFVEEGAPLGEHTPAPHTVGYFAYDLGALVEARIRPRRDAGSTLPLARLARYDAVVELRAGAAASGGTATLRIHGSDAAAQRCAQRLRALAAAARVSPSRTAAASPARIVEAPRAEVHARAIARALAYVAAGDVYQVNLAQRFRVQSDEHPADVFLRLRDAQPVPFASYLDGDGFAVLCGSPERFLRVRGRRIETEPIKGTRRRGGDAADDAALRRALRADPKERAEHVMIVDLERNDLGRVCTTGSVHVPSLMRVESFVTLHHMVSTVRGTLRDDVGLGELLRATFPGGSITGAPKIRATQIIAELESAPREIYTGALAWFRGPRDFDSAIAIRTAVAREGVFTYHAGGGIVADSDPTREFAECLLKAEPFLRALRVAAPARGEAGAGRAAHDASGPTEPRA